MLYCAVIALAFLSSAASLAAVFFSAGRLSASLNLALAVLALVALLLASVLVSAVVVKAADVVNMYGYRVGVEARRGGKFLGLTWAATAVMGLAVVVW